MIKLYTHTLSFELESGQKIDNLKLAYSIFGNAEAKETVWVCHALTGHPNVEEWWGGLFGKNRLFDFDKYRVICVNAIGSCYGSTGPEKLNESLSFPTITIRDIVHALDILRIELNIQTIDYLIGASLGGQQALEWALFIPERIKNLILIATNAVHSPYGIAFNESQRMALLADPTFGQPNGGKEGLKAARAIAMISYRSYEDFEQKQTDENRELDNYRAASYLQYQGEKFENRFSAASYFYLSKAMDSHDVARNRGELEQILKTIQAKTLVVGVDSDQLFPLKEQQFLAEHIPSAQLGIIHSSHGHDAFLIEYEQLNRMIECFINNEMEPAVLESVSTQLKCQTRLKTTF